MTLDAFDAGKHIFDAHVDIQHTAEWGPTGTEGGKHEREPKYMHTITTLPSRNTGAESVQNRHATEHVSVSEVF